MQALPADPESLVVIETVGEETGSSSIIHLNIGLQNGCLLRATLDQVTGDLTDNRTRYLGTRPVRLFRVKIQDKEAVCVILRNLCRNVSILALRMFEPGLVVLQVRLHQKEFQNLIHRLVIKADSISRR